MPEEPRDFGETLQEYKRSREKILGGPLKTADEKKLSTKQIEARKREAAKRSERKRAVEEKLLAQRRLHEEKLRKVRERDAAKELARLEREREKHMRAVEREVQRVRAEELRAKKREEQARERLEKYQEMEERRKEKEAQTTTRKRWQERSTVEDELLPDSPVPAGIQCAWESGGEDEEKRLDQGDLIMAWSFLNANSKEILAPRLSLAELREALTEPRRALDLTDIHVALLRVLLLHMDTQMGPEYQTQPPRRDLLTTLTWPYMASMFLEENATRETETDREREYMEMATLLGDREYCSLPPQTKLRLLTLLCDECVGVDPIKSKYSDSRTLDIEWNNPHLRRTQNDVEKQEALAADEDAIRSCYLLGTDRYRNRFFACQDHSGGIWVLVQQVDQGCWKRYQNDYAVPSVEGSDSDDELFAELDAAEEEERAAQRARLEAEKAAQLAFEEEKAAQRERERQGIAANLEALVDEASIAAAAVSASLPLVVSATVASLPLPAPAKPRAPKGFNNRRGVFCEDCKLKCVSASLRVCPCVSLCVPLCLMCTGRSRSANYGLPDGTGKRKRWCDPTSTSRFPSRFLIVN